MELSVTEGYVLLKQGEEIILGTLVLAYGKGPWVPVEFAKHQRSNPCKDWAYTFHSDKWNGEPHDVAGGTSNGNFPMCRPMV